MSEFGSYTYAFSFTVLFNVLADMGVSIVFVRECARAQDRVQVLLGRVLRLKLLLTGVTLAATTAVAFATRASPATLALIGLFTLAMLLNSTALLFEGLLKAAGRAGHAGVSLCAQSVTALGVGAALVLSGRGAVGGALAVLCAAAIHGAVAAWLARDLWRGGREAPGDAGAWRACWELFRESAPLAVSGAFIALYFRVDSILLHAIKGSVAVGLYGAIYRLFEAFTLFNAAFRSVLFPFMARAADGPAEALAVLCRKSFRIVLLFTVGLAAFVSCRASEIVRLILGPSYAAAAPGLAILFWALPGAFTADMLLHALTAQRRQASGTRVVGVVAAVNVALNLVLIPLYSFMGASIATVASEILCAGLLFAMVRRSVPLSGLLRTAIAPLLAGAILIGAVSLLGPLVPDGVAGLLASGGVAAAAYLVALVLMRAVGREDARLVLDLFPPSMRPRSTKV